MGLETDEERLERKRKEEEERLRKLPTPEREKLIARRKKFEGKSEVNLKEGKKISLKSNSEVEGTDATKENKQQRRPTFERMETTEASDVLNMDVADTLDMC